MSAIRSGRLSMSSRWISISLSGALLAWRASVALTPACAAFTSDDLPMPRAPHSSALLAGRPLAKRSVFSTSTSRTRSMPLSSDISTRLTRLTGASRRPSGCQTKASAPAKSGSGRALRRQPLERVGDALEHVGAAGGLAPWLWTWLWTWTAIWTSIWPWGVLSESALLLAGRRCPRKRAGAKTAKSGRF